VTFGIILNCYIESLHTSIDTHSSSESSMGLGPGLSRLPSESEDLVLALALFGSTPKAQPEAVCCSCQSFIPRLCRCRPLLIQPRHPLVEPVPAYMTTRFRESPESPSPWPAFASQWRPRAVTPSASQLQTPVLDSKQLTPFKVFPGSLIISIQYE
jgi:hypothetical protein